MTDYVAANLQSIREQVAANPDDPYYRVMGLIMLQFDGIVEGYARVAPAAEAWTELDHWLAQAAGGRPRASSTTLCVSSRSLAAALRTACCSSATLSTAGTTRSKR
eukprot:gnl/Ergobibamus_cyprinoides/4904.p2 GENE.gnl/Ergobibamus_cyprinoides/4904~~gnl/Ergobibamus_cyprinoides/4904.p2  ORF type:complete len:115 (+),score=21.38 gnl/Ergobibamus_cyprinoides/4904:28-345(+)